MKFLAWIKKHKILTFLGVVALVVVVFFVYLRIDLELNKRAFQQASKAIDTIYADIVKEVGPPGDKNDSSRCRGFRGVYGEGPLSCYLDKNFVYPVKNKSEADQLRVKIQDIVMQQDRFIRQPTPSNTINYPKADSDSAPFTEYYRFKGGIECIVNYIYNPTFNSSLGLKDPETYKQFYVSFSCSGPANAKYF